MNSNSIDIKIVAKDIASDVIKGVSNDIRGMKKEADGFSAAGSILTGVVTGITTSIINLGASIISSGIQTMAGFFSDAVDKASQLETNLKVLSIVAPRFGVGADEATEAAKALGKELRIGVGPAAESLQNLLKSGLNLGQARELLKRFTNEAMTGKSPTISLSQAVQNLSFAYATNNSALGNLSGVSENWSDITEKGRKKLIEQGMAVESITDDMAKYQGILDLTNLTLGSSELLTDTYASKQILLNQKFEEFQTKIGGFLLPIVAELFQVFTELFDEVSPKLEDLAARIIPEIGRLFRDVIVPEIRRFIEYLGSDQFKKDLQYWKDTFVDIRDTSVNINATFAGIKASLAYIVGRAVVLADTMRSIFSMGGGTLGSIFAAIPKYADGTNYHPGGMAIVGERGPELVNLPRGSQVIPNESMGTRITNIFHGYDASQISSTINNQINLGY